MYLIKPPGKSQSGKKKLSQAGQASVTGNCAFPRRGLARPQAWMVVESVHFWGFWVGSNASKRSWLQSDTKLGLDKPVDTCRDEEST